MMFVDRNSKLSVFTYKENINVFPLPIIVSGQIEKENLKYIDKSEKWVIEQLNKQGLENIKDVYGASFMNNNLKVVKKNKSV